MTILKIDNLRKNFRETQVLANLCLSIDEGTICGFVGKNGAGKTTTMKLILGLLKADEGDIFVCGEKVTFGENKTNNYIGYLPDVPEFYNFMTPKEYLALCGNIKRMGKNEIESKSKELLKLVGIKTNRKIGTFSRGMKQRLGIAQALITSPKLLICDEPTSALDPVGRAEILDILLKVKSHTTVLFSTHILSDVERICDKVCIINEGKIALDGSISEIKEHYKSNHIDIEFVDAQNVEEFFARQEYITSFQKNGSTYTVTVKDLLRDGTKLLSESLANNLVVSKFFFHEPTLDSLFMEVIS